jgi:hypothetical protein
LSCKGIHQSVNLLCFTWQSKMREELSVVIIVCYGLAKSR